MTEDETIEWAAELYLESPQAQHDDPEVARWEAELWLDLFREAGMTIKSDPDYGGM